MAEVIRGLAKGRGGEGSILDRIASPADVKALSLEECDILAGEIRQFLVEAVSRTGGHLGSNLGAVELTIALHRVFDSPSDMLVFDTGHQAYVHKLLTGRKDGFEHLRQQGGLSGYPNRAESPHDLVENSHASTALSYAYGLSSALRLGEDAHGTNGSARPGHRSEKGAEDPPARHVVAVVGDGALTGGMAYEALNNLGHASARVLIVLNDNGRSYAPTISRLSGSLTQLRLDPRYVHLKRRVKGALRDMPRTRSLAGRSLHSLTSALREVVEPHVFFDALGVAYTGPIDGHNVGALEQAIRRASTWPGPIVLHVLTRKGKGYGPAEKDEVACLHDLKVAPKPAAQSATAANAAGGSQQSGSGAPLAVPIGPAVADDGAIPPPARLGESYTDAFTKALLRQADLDKRIVAITAAMPGPTGLLSFEERHPDRFFDVGIAEQHAMTAAAGMAMAGLRPVVAIYSTFLSRAVDQWNLDVGLHGLPVVVVADRAGVTGDDGPSHHGLYDLVQALQIPSCSVICPSEPAELDGALEAAISMNGPALVRYPKTLSPGPLARPGSGLRARLLRDGDPSIVLVGVGKLARACLQAAEMLSEDGIEVTCLDPRVIRPADPVMLQQLAAASLVVTAEDGLAHGGAGEHLIRLATHLADGECLPGPRTLVLGAPTQYLPHGKPDEILSRLGLDGPGIAASVRAAVTRFRIPVRRARSIPLAAAGLGRVEGARSGRHNGLADYHGLETHNGSVRNGTSQNGRRGSERRGQERRGQERRRPEWRGSERRPSRGVPPGDLGG